MKKKKNIERYTIELKTTFEFTYYENVQNLTMALSRSGYFINITNSSGRYIVNVFKIKSNE